MVTIPPAKASWTLLPVEPQELSEELACCLAVSCSFSPGGERTLVVELPTPVGGSRSGLLVLPLVRSGWVVKQNSVGMWTYFHRKSKQTTWVCILEGQIFHVHFLCGRTAVFLAPLLWLKFPQNLEINLSLKIRTFRDLAVPPLGVLTLCSLPNKWWGFFIMLRNSHICLWLPCEDSFHHFYSHFLNELYPHLPFIL